MVPIEFVGNLFWTVWNIIILDMITLEGLVEIDVRNFITLDLMYQTSKL